MSAENIIPLPMCLLEREVSIFLLSKLQEEEIVYLHKSGPRELGPTYHASCSNICHVKGHELAVGKLLVHDL